MIIDAFMFFNEFEILDVRLHEMGPVVDQFLILEARETFSGNPKPAYLSENPVVLEPFRKKIRLEILDKLEPTFSNDTIWQREWYQRNHLDRLLWAEDEDIVIISDCDEIVKRSVLANRYWHYSRELITIEHDLFYYNERNCMGKQKAAVIGPYGMIKEQGGPQAVREKNNQYPVIPNAGWHFSYFCTPDKIRYKIQSFSHALDEPWQDVAKRPNHLIQADIEANRDLLRRPEMVHIPYTSSLPEYMVNR